MGLYQITHKWCYLVQPRNFLQERDLWLWLDYTHHKNSR